MVKKRKMKNGIKEERKEGRRGKELIWERRTGRIG